MRLAHTVAIYLADRDVVYLSRGGPAWAYPCGYVCRSMLCLSVLSSPSGHWNKVMLCTYFCRFLPFPGDVVLAIVFMPIILLICGYALSRYPNFPFASAHHIRRLVVGICVMVSCARSHCCFSSTVYPMFGAYVSRMIVGDVSFFLAVAIFRIGRPTRPILSIGVLMSSCARIATPPCYMPDLVFFLLVFLSVVVMGRYPFFMYGK